MGRENLIILRQKIALFTEREIIHREDSCSLEEFPLDIWNKMGKEGFLGLNLPQKYGGGGYDHLSIVVAGEELVRRGCSLGLALSWLLHLGTANFLILSFGNERQLDEYLSHLANGRITVSLAYGEPTSGGNPKNLKTLARRQGESYILNGEKFYLTNGPIADLFIVFAITGEEGHKKRLTAFLVPKNTQGLSLTNSIDVKFLNPSPHCGLKMENCLVPRSSVLGKEGWAYEEMLKPWREYEDVYMMGPIIGGMERELVLLVNIMKNQEGALTDELTSGLGELQAILQALRVIAYEAAGMMDSSMHHPEFPGLLLSFRIIARQFQSLFNHVMLKSGIKENAELVQLTGGINSFLNIAKNLMFLKQKKLGKEAITDFYSNR